MTTTVSSKFQIVIPREIRDNLQIKPGTRLEVISYGGRIEFIPVQPMKRVRGSLKGMNTDIAREGDRV
jgi:AbrB family looped-hinge helix DNA binding protein